MSQGIQAKTQEAMQARSLDRSNGVGVTATQVGNGKYALDVHNRGTVSTVTTDAVDSFDVTSNTITAAAHSARVGDLIRFTSSTLDGTEATVYEIDTNTIKLTEDLAAVPAPADTFEIMRPTSVRVTSDGSFAGGPSTYLLDSVTTNVAKDTVTPANSRPFPVEILGSGSPINITAGDLNVQLSHSDVSFDSTRIGDGVEIMLVNAAGEAQVSDDTARASLATIAGDTTSLDAKLPAQGAAATAASTPVNIASDQTVPISAASLPLPTGASTEATLSTVAGDTTSLDAKQPAQGAALTAASVPVNIASDQVVPVSATALPLPTGAATEATLASLNGKVTAVDTTNVTVGSSVLPTGAATQTTLASIDGNITACNTGAVVISSSALPTGAATSANQSTANTSLSNLETNTKILDVVDQIDTTPLLDTSSTNIPASSGNPVEIVSSLAARTRKVVAVEDIGEFIGIYEGAALSETLIGVLPLGGGELEFDVAASTRISLRAMENTAISLGKIAINFLG